MANALYTVYKDVRNGATTYTLPNLTTSTIKAVLCSSTYTPSIDSDTYLSDVPSGARVATQTVATISRANGAVLVSSTCTFTSVTGAVCTQLVLYKDTGSAATSPLLAYFDTFTSGMPVTPSGTNIDVNFDVQGIWST